ncbi:MAG: DegT/DnrJ/EryC1/StrS family aminotransferase [Planctomycetota bacterium]|nr:DegT/DnrJ/EryC1/StrS family aminotransferase [Planctomycetota bacterium]
MQFIDLTVQQEAIREELDRRIAAVLSHGQYIMGPEVQELEDVLRDYVGVRHCITVSSGTDALLISLMALGVGPGDEVITTPFTFISTAEVIVLLGATPVFVDVERDTGLIDAELIEERITPRTKAIIPVSLYGQIPDMNRINEIAARHGDVTVIEDAAQSFGATYHGRRSCAVSTIGCTSFFPSKPLGCYGDGGAIFTNDDAIADAARAIRVHGQKKRYVHMVVGVGGRMDTLQCAIVLAKWPRFEDEVRRRGSIGQRYTDLLGAATGPCVDTASVCARTSPKMLTLMKVRPSRSSVYAQYTVVVPDRDTVWSRLTADGIPTAVHYPLPINEQPAYRTFGRGPTPVAAWLARRVLSLPMGPDLAPADQDRVVEKLLAAYAFVAFPGRQGTTNCFRHLCAKRAAG